ncbi:MAG: methylated-DNA--protein-cysteine methyltransferase [Alphaproteobacteria bacterium]|nr:MAG: methylated-DNA--protein-cysteine methyltransferase [Alphaproteobacteria bacterium]
MPDEPVFFCHVDTPIGPMLLAGGPGRLLVASFPSGGRARRPRPGWAEDRAALAAAAGQLGEYFAGERTEFELQLEPRGNPFQMAVWAEMRRIPYGETVSYGEIARRIGEPLSASRAVGAASGANPLPVFIPCHRVVGADRSLVGFGGGLPTKRFLLDLEFRVRPPGDTLFAWT